MFFLFFTEKIIRNNEGEFYLKPKKKNERNVFLREIKIKIEA